MEEETGTVKMVMSKKKTVKMVKMGVEEGNLEGLIATSGGIATPKLIDMLVYNANKKYLQALKRLLKK